MVDTVIITSEPNVAPEGHDQAMMDLVDNNAAIPTDDLNDPPASTESRPEWLPEKFKSPEDMAKAYAELESKLGAGKPAEKPEATPGEKPADTPEAAQEMLAEKGLDFNALQTEYAANGGLSDETYAKLAKAGIDRNVADQYIEGRKAVAAQYESGIKAEVGGDERYTEMISWAVANLSPEEIAVYNQAVSSGNAEQAKLAALGLSAKYSKAVGNEPQRMLGGQKAGTADVFESTAQVTEAMRDPRYRNDPAYRNKVQQKLARSNIF